MSKNRGKKTPTPSSSSSSAHPIQQNPSASTSTTSVSQTTTANRDGGSQAGSTMSRSAASALEATASVVHRVKSQVPETLQSVSQNIPQRLPQNLTRWTGTKATASTQVAQETAGRSASFSASSPKSSSPMNKHLSPSKPTTQLTSLPNGSDPKVNGSDEPTSVPDQEDSQGMSMANASEGLNPPKDDPSTRTTEVTIQPEPKTASSSSWLSSWWGPGQAPASQDPTLTSNPKDTTTPQPETTLPPPPVLPVIDNLKADNKTLQKVRSAENLGIKKNFNSSKASIKTAPPTLLDTPVPQSTPEEIPKSNTQPSTTEPPLPSNSQRSSWFGLLGYGGAAQNTVDPAKDKDMNGVETAPNEDPKDADGPLKDGETAAADDNLAPTEEASQPPQPQPAPADGILARGAAWVFWSKPQAQTDGSAKTAEVGEIAVAGSSSEAEPQKVKVTTESPQPAAAVPRKKSSKNSLSNSLTSTIAPAKQEPSIPVDPKEVSPAAKRLQKVLPPNLLVPSFDSCFNPRQSSTWLGSVSRLWSAPKAISRNQLYLTPLPPRIRKAVAIGVHGFFPMKLVQRVLGEPTGTSVRFATAGAAAISRWAEKHGLSVDIEKIALEGEGRVSDRVEVLWKLLENRLDLIQRADFILVCCHSQGTPVGVHLVARMIEYGLVERTKIGIIGMAGINLGPFPELNSRILTGSARELFEFSDPTSLVSQEYVMSLSAVVAHGVKLVFVGSIDDQLVSLYSSTFSNISHPFIYRAVFVDGRVHAPDFISHVVGLALKLRNLGVRDHGIVRELSAPLAGSLYSGEGHSRIYDDAAIYDLGVRHTLETSTKEYLRVPLKVEDFELPSTTNPYVLPWAMRGMLEEKRVQEELHGEAQLLLEEFAKWQPISKPLKDVKFRLEAIRSKL